MPEKLSRSTVHLQQPPLVLALIAALLRLKVRRAEQMELVLGKEHR